MKSIFQLHHNSAPITTKDVREALKKTQTMTPHQKLKYFHNKGIHFSRSVKYINIVENLQQLYETDAVQEVHNADYRIIISNDTQDNHKMSMTEISDFINELLKDYESN